MSDDNRNDAGQFTAAPEPAFGKEGIERDAGYVPFKDETEATAEPQEELTVAEAAELISGTPESEIKTYSALDSLPDNVTLTLEQATNLLSDERAADESQAELEAADQIRKEVDELRGENAKAAEATPQTEIGKDPE